jgi:hypothetical protein
MSKAKWSGECEQLAVGSRWSERSKRSRSGMSMRRSGEGTTFRQRGQRREEDPCDSPLIVAGAAAAAIARAAVGGAS